MARVYSLKVLLFCQCADSIFEAQRSFIVTVVTVFWVENLIVNLTK